MQKSNLKTINMGDFNVTNFIWSGQSEINSLEKHQKVSRALPNHSFLVVNQPPEVLAKLFLVCLN